MELSSFVSCDPIFEVPAETVKGKGVIDDRRVEKRVGGNSAQDVVLLLYEHRADWQKRRWSRERHQGRLGGNPAADVVLPLSGHREDRYAAGAVEGSAEQ